MNFGRVEPSSLDKVNLKLPKEPYTNSIVLKRRPAAAPKFYVGLSSWGKKEWIGNFYPRGIKDMDFLCEYVKRFNAIELNTTHYKLSSHEDIKNWLDQTGENPFVFCPKFYQGISHAGSLNDKQFLTDTFLDTLRRFGKRLGPGFLQVSDNFGPDRKEELFTYLITLPRDLPFFLEVRHPHWFRLPVLHELVYTLQKLKIGFIITDTAGRRDAVHMNVTSLRTMIRFVGQGNHETDFRRLDEWVSRIHHWVESGLQEMYFFVHSLNGRYAPDLAQYLVRKLNEKRSPGLLQNERVPPH